MCQHKRARCLLSTLLFHSFCESDKHCLCVSSIARGIRYLRLTMESNKDPFQRGAAALNDSLNSSDPNSSFKMMEGIKFENRQCVTFECNPMAFEVINRDYLLPTICLEKELLTKCRLIFSCHELLSQINSYKVFWALNFFSVPQADDSADYSLEMYTGDSEVGHSFVLKRRPNETKKWVSQVHTIQLPELKQASQIKLGLRLSSVNDYFNPYRLSTNLEHLFKNEEFADLKIQVPGKEFNVHKCLLSCRSNVLAKYVANDMTESRNGVITFKDFDPVALREILKYIYTDYCDLTIMPHELFKMADYFELMYLKVQCKNFMLKNICLENIVDFLGLTYLYSDELKDLKEAAMKFVHRHGKVLSTHPVYVDFLVNSMAVHNFVYIAKFADMYNMDKLWNRLVEFYLQNKKRIVLDPQCKQFFLGTPNVLLRILESVVTSTLTISEDASTSTKDDTEDL